MQNRSALFILLILTIILASSSYGQVDSLQTGRVLLQFTEPHPLTHPKEMLPRHGWDKMTEAGTHITTGVYDLAEETFSAYIPKSYDGSKPYGLIVWITAGTLGGPPDIYLPVLDKHEYIWFGGNNIGNRRQVPDRMGITLDGLHNMIKLYNIDLDRIYVSGISGGGRIASKLAVIYPDLFSGGYYIIGCDYRENLPTDIEGQFWPGFWPFYDVDLVEMGHKNRYTLLTGSKDYNKLVTQRVWQAYRKEGKKWITYVEVPGMDHRLPNAEWYEIGLVALERSRRLSKGSSGSWISCPGKNAIDQERIAGHIREAETKMDTTPLTSAYLLDCIRRNFKNYPEINRVKALLKSVTKDKAIKEALKIRFQIDEWYSKIRDKGFSRDWIKKMLKLEKSIIKVIDMSPSDALRSELEMLLETL